MIGSYGLHAATRVLANIPQQLGSLPASIRLVTLLDHEPFVPTSGDERTLLAAFLDWHRWAAANKLRGLTEAESRMTPTPSSLSLLAIVHHLAFVETLWFDVSIGGRVDSGAHAAAEAALAIPDDATVEGVLALYAANAERSRVVLNTASLDDLARGGDAAALGLSVRWIVLHMIDETARHVGHADVIREAIDGSTGD